MITCLNLLTGAAGCVVIIEGNYHVAIYFVAIAGFFDFLDGLAARLLGVQSAIGKELDSLADMISFGLLPSLYMLMVMRNLNPAYELLPYVALGIAAFSALRLARFNIDDRQTNEFIGLPTPANALMATSLSFWPIATDHLWGMMVFILVSCGLLVANLPLIALKFKGTGWVANKWKYILILLITGALIGFQSAALPLVIPLYLLISIIRNFTS